MLIAVAVSRRVLHQLAAEKGCRAQRSQGRSESGTRKGGTRKGVAAARAAQP